VAVGPREGIRAWRVAGECRHAVQREERNDGALMWVGGAAVCAGVHLFRRCRRRHDGGGVRPLRIARLFQFFFISSCWGACWRRYGRLHRGCIVSLPILVRKCDQRGSRSNSDGNRKIQKKQKGISSGLQGAAGGMRFRAAGATGR